MTQTSELVVVDWKRFKDIHVYDRFWWCGKEYYKTKLVDGECIAKPVPGQIPRPLAQALRDDAIVEIKAERAAVEDYIRFNMRRLERKKVEWIKDGF
jgi:hypothetical protein